MPFPIICFSCGYHRSWTTMADAIADGRHHTARAGDIQALSSERCLRPRRPTRGTAGIQLCGTPAPRAKSLTKGEVAQLCRMQIRTVDRWVAADKISGFRTRAAAC